MDLEESGYISKSKVGRRNQYTINSNKPLRHSIESHHTIKTLLKIVER
jgi:predicted transcriptional regulator